MVEGLKYGSKCPVKCGFEPIGYSHIIYSGDGYFSDGSYHCSVEIKRFNLNGSTGRPVVNLDVPLAMSVDVFEICEMELH